jgi:transposase
MLNATWPGPYALEARSAYQRARESGISAARALVLGSIASFKDCFAFRSTLAEHLDLSVRTVQRAITQAKECGLIGVARSKLGEQLTRDDGSKYQLPCGFSHRWTIGWGCAYEQAKAAVAQTRLARMVKRAAMVLQPKPAPAPDPKPAAKAERPEWPATRRWTVEEIDLELERRHGVKPSPE